MASDGRRRLVEHIKTVIACGNYRPGDKLPPMRVLGEQFQLTLSTTRNAMVELERAGLVELRRGDGIYVRNTIPGTHERPNRRIIAFFDQFASMNPEGSFCAHALRGLQEEAAAHRCRVEMRFERFYFQNRPLRVSAEELHGGDCIVFLGTFDWNGLVLPPGIPAAGLGTADLGGGQISSIWLDPFSTAELAVEFFRRRGIDRVRVFSLEFGTSLQVLQCFRNAFAPFGTIDFYPLHGVETPQEEFLDPEIGYFFTNGSTCNCVSRDYVARHGRPIFPERTVLSVDGKSRYIPGYFPVNNIGVDWVQAGRNLFTECDFRMNHPEQRARRIFMMPDLQEMD